MALTNYTQLKLFLNSNRLEQITSVSATWEANRQQVDLMEGLGGFTEGSGNVTIEVGLSVPISGLEDDFSGLMVVGNIVTMQLGVGQGSYIGEGKLNALSISGSANANTEGSFTFIGEFNPIE